MKEKALADSQKQNETALQKLHAARQARDTAGFAYRDTDLCRLIIQFIEHRMASGDHRKRMKSCRLE
jgi:hypothetical protein